MQTLQVVANTQLSLRGLRLPVLWAELDSRLGQAECEVHSQTARDYRLGGIALEVRATGNTLSAIWASDSTVLTPRSRVDLIQCAQAWVQSLYSVERSLEPAYARLDVLSALLVAGFQTVHLAANRQRLALDSDTATDGPKQGFNDFAAGEVMAVC